MLNLGMEYMLLAIGAHGSKKDCELLLMTVNSSVTLLRHSGCHFTVIMYMVLMISEHCLLHRRLAAT